ncbi:MAG: polysaccharide deacetylase family protein [Candidatus Nitricoxidivorans perseverans]|uniref:Polysaccharide deacetylase family protein n=1 Tax=Candidatus Nitricoxidivorans perseverans TaxID=2975601 RepID=A0AA49IZ18_9PROT|nr:MAG: polysaccharide deacetylase family protein [Candidatus Nitricoxidivorans perseverans]
MNILTFDIEDWFHLLDNESTKTEAAWGDFSSRLECNTDRILDLLSETGARATFFCLGWVAQKYPHVIQKIHAAGYEIGSHSYAHQLAYEQTEAEFRTDLERVKKTLEDLTGNQVRAHRAPGFSFTRENTCVFSVMAELGIEHDSSIFPARRAHGGFDGFGEGRPTVIEHDGHEIRELPINVSPLLGQRIVFSGGGYFRLLPYSAIRYFTKRSSYVMTYFHPRDFDPDQPRVPGLSPARVFRSYYGLAGSLAKLRRFIGEFPVVDIAMANQQIDWATCPRVRV